MPVTRSLAQALALIAGILGRPPLASRPGILKLQQSPHLQKIPAAGWQDAARPPSSGASPSDGHTHDLCNEWLPTRNSQEWQVRRWREDELGSPLKLLSPNWCQATPAAFAELRGRVIGSGTAKNKGLPFVASAAVPSQGNC